MVERIFRLSILLVLFVGCSRSLNGGLSIDSFPEPVYRPVRGLHRLVEVDVQRFVDARPAPFVGYDDGHPVVARGDVAQNVLAVFRRELAEGGVFLTDRDGMTIRGKVLRWHVDVARGFPTSTASARASIEIEVFNPYKEKVYRARYEGDTVQRHPVMSQDRIEGTLGLAMRYAVREALRDGHFIDVLRKYSPANVG